MYTEIDSLNSAIIMLCSPGALAEVHVKVSLTLSTLAGFSRIIVFSLSIRTSPFILPLVKVFPFNDHTVSEGNPTSPNPHLKQRGLVSGSANAGIGMKTNTGF